MIIELRANILAGANGTQRETPDRCTFHFISPLLSEPMRSHFAKSLPRSCCVMIVVFAVWPRTGLPQSADKNWTNMGWPIEHSEISESDRCNLCIRPCETRPVTRLDLPGLWGRPYVEPVIGQCACGKRTGTTRHESASVYWARPIGGFADQTLPGTSNWLRNCAAPAIAAPFDRIGGFRGLPYRRTDNGHCGPGRDPYGCLGESQYYGDQLHQSVSER